MLLIAVLSGCGTPRWGGEEPVAVERLDVVAGEADRFWLLDGEREAAERVIAGAEALAEAPEAGVPAVRWTLSSGGLELESLGDEVWVERRGEDEPRYLGMAGLAPLLEQARSRAQASGSDARLARQALLAFVGQAQALARERKRALAWVLASGDQRVRAGRLEVLASAASWPLVDAVGGGRLATFRPPTGMGLHAGYGARWLSIEPDGTIRVGGHKDLASPITTSDPRRLQPLYRHFDLAFTLTSGQLMLVDVTPTQLRARVD